MADFLAGFDFGAAEPTESGNTQLFEVEEIQLSLRSAIEAKTTPTRAEHVHKSFEVSPEAQFSLKLSKSDHDALEGLSNVDPSLGGAHSVSMGEDAEEGQFLRAVGAREAIMEQPDNEPSLQTAVAGHVASAISTVDESEWVVRDVSRESSGSTFTYICKNSLKHWDMQDKKQARMIIAEYTLKDLDPVVLSKSP